MDLNGDGNVDLISGSWPGELFFFRGGPGRTFEAPVMLQDKDGHYINVGGGVEESADGMLLVNGDAEYKTDADTGQKYIDYHGQRLDPAPGQEMGISGTASAVHAADWDGDGDLDLLVGYIGGDVYLVPNEGTAKAWAFGREVALEVGDDALRVPGDAGPFVADWDRDGDQDLLVGAGDGSVSLFRNLGERGTPRLGPAEILVPEAESPWGDDLPEEARRGVRTKVCAADWNGDGWLDLLVGDFSQQKPDLPEPTAAEKAIHDQVRAELEGVKARWSELMDSLHGASRVKDAGGRAVLKAEADLLREKLRDLRAKLPPDSEEHGWIWLFERKPVERTAVGAVAGPP